MTKNELIKDIKDTYEKNIYKENVNIEINNDYEYIEINNGIDEYFFQCEEYKNLIKEYENISYEIGEYVSIEEYLLYISLNWW